MTRPDRFERMVLRKRLAGVLGVNRTKIIKCKDAIDLLRQEHAWMRRMVVKHQKSINGLRDSLAHDWANGYNQACEEILNVLTQRRK